MTDQEMIEVPRQWLDEAISLMEWAAGKLDARSGGRGHAGHRASKMKVNASHLRSTIPPDGGDSGDLPPGYELTGGSGGYHGLRGPDGVIEGPSNGKWQGAEAAAEAAWNDYTD